MLNTAAITVMSTTVTAPISSSAVASGIFTIYYLSILIAIYTMFHWIKTMVPFFDK